jgi:hypothetical protein
MPDDSYRASIKELATYYQLASDNSGKPQQFYTYLYRYVKTIDDNQQLYLAATEFWYGKFIEDNKADEKKLLRIFEPLVEESGRTPDRTRQYRFMWRLFGQISSERLKETKVYYCWYALYFYFYAIHKSNISTEAIAKAGSVDMKEIIAYVKELFGEDMPEIPDELLDRLKPLDTKKLAEKFDEMLSSTIPYDSSISIDEYEACLGVFHTDFMDWLQHNEDRVGNFGEAHLTEVGLYFYNDIYPRIKLPTGEEHTFSYMKPKAHAIIKYCYEKPGIAIGTDKFPDIDFQGKGIVNALRGSKFYPDEGGVLFVFLTVQDKPKPAKIILHRKRKLTDSQLALLVKEAEGTSTNSQ